MHPNSIIRVKITDYICKRFLENKPGFFGPLVLDQTCLAVESQTRLANDCQSRLLLMTINPASPFLTIKPASPLLSLINSAVDNQSRLLLMIIKPAFLIEFSTSPNRKTALMPLLVTSNMVLSFDVFKTENTEKICYKVRIYSN